MSLIRPIVSLLLAAIIWLSSLAWVFGPKLSEYRQPAAIAPRAREIAAYHLRLWEDPALRTREVAHMRRSNAEWDFMGRTFLVLALANMSLSDAANAARYLAVIDHIVDETLRLEESEGMYFFLMPYAHRAPFIAQPARSTFLDGEIAIMLAARQMVEPNPRYAPLLAARVDLLTGYLTQSPVFCGESYPDECWLFCNAIAIDAIHLSDRLDGRDHSSLIRRWLEIVKTDLLDKTSGLLVSSFTYTGRHMDGPEGSSIWMIAHCLELVDPEFADQQYGLARARLGRSIFGFGYAREWPSTWQGPPDIDSGPIVAVLGASAGSSGLAILGAAAFNDDHFLQQLLNSLEFAGFAIKEGETRRYGASNQVGDAVLLYALTQGPLWRKVNGLPSPEPRK